MRLADRLSRRRCRWIVCGLFVVAAPVPAFAQLSEPRALVETRPPRFSVKPTDVEVLLACEAVLHAVDMFTTGYDLSIGGQAHEGNPVLKPFARHPVPLTLTMGAVNILQTYTIAKLQHRHSKLSRWWALALVA